MAEPYEAFKPDTTEGETKLCDTKQDEDKVKASYNQTKDRSGNPVYDADRALEKIYRTAPKIIEEATRRAFAASDKVSGALDASDDLIAGKEDDLVQGAIAAVEALTYVVGELEAYALDVTDQDAHNRCQAHQRISELEAEVKKRPALKAGALKAKLNSAVVELSARLQPQKRPPGSP